MSRASLGTLLFLVLAGGLWAYKHWFRTESLPTRVESREEGPGSIGAGSRPGDALRALLESRAHAATTSELPDPDGVGPLPALAEKVASPVVRRARDGDGFATWWHADGSMTKRVEQTLRDSEGKAYKVPSVVRVAPGAKAPTGAQRPR